LTGGTGNAFPSEAPEFTLVSSGVCVAARTKLCCKQWIQFATFNGKI